MLIHLTLASILLGLAIASQLPPSIQKCSKSAPKAELTRCLTAQAVNFGPQFIEGIPEFGIEPLDPMSLDKLESRAGTFNLKSKNVMVKGLRKMQIQELGFDFAKMTGHMKLFGNVTFISDYTTEGRLLLIPLSGTGKLTVKLWDLEVLTSYKIRTVKDANGVEHFETYDQNPTQMYNGGAQIKITNILGSGEFDEAVNQILNQNWRDLMQELGPGYINAIVNKIEALINRLYSKIPFEDLFAP